MATNTPNYGLKKFENGDPPDLPSLAASMDKIDTELKKNETNIGLFGLKTMDSTTDFNTLTSGIYSYGGWSSNPNTPGIHGFLWVVAHSAYKMQILIGSTEIRWRNNVAGTWSAWKRVEGLLV